MTDLSRYNRISLDTMQAIVELLPPSEQGKVAALLEQGFRLRLSTVIGAQPDVTLSILDDYNHETLIYSLLGKAGETLQ
jgi:hypothetical protein